MFWNIFSKRILFSLRSKDTLIWTWIFPVMLATLFFATLTGVDEIGNLRDIPLAAVENEAYIKDTSLQEMLNTLSLNGEDQLFNLTIVKDISQAEVLLKNGEVSAYIHLDNTPTLIVKDDDLNQTIIRSVLDRYWQTSQVVEEIYRNNPKAIEGISDILETSSYTEELSLSGNSANDSLNYYYALLAMICLYGAFQGLTTVSLLQGNLSPLGARNTMSPVKRFKMVLYDLLGGITVHYLCLLFTLGYIVFVLGVDFGSKFALVLLTCLAGSLLGVAFGAVVSVASKLKEQAKIAILICVTMVSCFMAGLMVNGINYTIAQKAPIVALINPAARITDAFYCLYYYDNLNRYLTNIVIILALAFVMFAVTSISIGRQKYESI